MEIGQDVLAQLSLSREGPEYTEEEIRGLMAAVEVPQFANDERRVEFDLVRLGEKDGGAAYIKSDFRLTAVVPSDDQGWFAIFMRMSPSVEELEIMRFQKVVQDVLANAAAFRYDGDSETPDNVIEMFRAMAGEEEDA